MFKYTAFTSLIICSVLSVKAQEKQVLERMETDRPDQTECPFIVPKGWVQFESGFNFEHNSPGSHSLVYPTLLSKYGVSKRLELRVITSVLSNRDNNGYGYETVTGIDPVQLGFKAAIMEEKGLLPKTSIIAHVAFPSLASEKMKAEKIAPNFVFTMQHTVTKWMGIGYNLGASWDGFSNQPSWIYRFSPGISIGKRGYAYAEAFGFIQKDEAANHNIDGGFAYYFNDDAKIDISAGKGLSQSSMDYYIALGFSIRFRL